EVRLGAVVGHEDLAVLIGAHRARIDVEIRVQLAQADLIAPRLQKSAESGGGEAFSKRGNHAAGDEHIASHGRTPYSMIRPERRGSEQIQLLIKRRKRASRRASSNSIATSPLLGGRALTGGQDRKSTRLNSSHV